METTLTSESPWPESGMKGHPQVTVCRAELVEGEVGRTPNGAVLSAKLVIKAHLVVIRIETNSGSRVISG